MGGSITRSREGVQREKRNRTMILSRRWVWGCRVFLQSLPALLETANCSGHGAPGAEGLCGPRLWSRTRSQPAKQLSLTISQGYCSIPQNPINPLSVIGKTSPSRCLWPLHHQDDVAGFFQSIVLEVKHCTLLTSLTTA